MADDFQDDFGPQSMSIFFRSDHPTSPMKKLIRENQWHAWTYDVISALVPVYMQLLHKTESLRNTEALSLPGRPGCKCNKRTLAIAVVRMTRIEHISLIVCACSPAPVSLLRAGLFGCSPRHPSLAVDLQVLDFVMTLFLNVAPNNTAMANTLEGFLPKRGYKLATKDTLRVRFSNALEWYTSLCLATRTKIDKLLDDAWEKALDFGDPNPATSSATQNDPFDDLPPSSPPPASLSPVCGATTSTPDSSPIRPCPSTTTLTPDSSPIRPHPSTTPTPTPDPARAHPQTVFVPAETAAQMGAHVEHVRPSKDKPAKEARVAEQEDGYDPGLKVPRSVLIECEKSFKAADKNREKASTKFFEDMGIMDLLCHHNRVLFLVNMRSAGEKQYYMLSLETLFQHLPVDIRVGILYDIACLLHVSCLKYKFLWRYLDRILFGVSVFHAFSHRWPCQIIYHPLKCAGFGFTNREGCERFWHSISNLIAYLHVCGYHRRIFTIGLQIEHTDRASLARLASWLARRTIHCEEKRREALADLKACGHGEAVLREHWKNQVEVQTRPLKRTFLIALSVDQVLAARKASETAFEWVTFLTETLADGSNPPHERIYAELHIDAARKSLKQAKDKVKQLEKTLGIQDSTLVKKLTHSAYYEAQMNAKVVKERLVSKLRDRKFELDPIERSFRRTRSENQCNEHLGQAIKRREPNINKLIQTYNKLCGQIAKLIRDNWAPKAPPETEEKGIYQLDVDDLIWQDLGLDEDDEEPPVWLTDDRVQSGIRAMHQKDRCEEEAPHLLRERGHLQIWFATEWIVVCDLIAATEGGIRYQFELRRQELLELYVHWKKSLDRIAFDDTDLPDWGPTDTEVKACQESNVTPSWIEEEAVGEDEGNESDGLEYDEGDDEDDDIFQIVEAVERADNHRSGNEDADFWV
ncbi:hypothetical protein C8R45DRAFT_1152106 [Mycena sanguinolenta]|nr:hypothetical protein C8R45DRAFT_1152106 [Mycena sanguinolenta]